MNYPMNPMNPMGQMGTAPQQAYGLSSLGRGDDSMLVHMTPHEVQGLQSLATAHGGSLTINPNTGLPEAGALSALLPMLIGGATATLGGAGIPYLSKLASSPWLLGLASGLGATIASKGDLSEGLRWGLGTTAGAGLYKGISGMMGPGSTGGAPGATRGASPDFTFGETGNPKQYDTTGVFTAPIRSTAPIGTNSWENFDPGLGKFVGTGGKGALGVAALGLGSLSAKKPKKMKLKPIKEDIDYGPGGKYEYLGPYTYPERRATAATRREIELGMEHDYFGSSYPGEISPFAAGGEVFKQNTYNAKNLPFTQAGVGNANYGINDSNVWARVEKLRQHQTEKAGGSKELWGNLARWTDTNQSPKLGQAQKDLWDQYIASGKRPAGLLGSTALTATDWALRDVGRAQQHKPVNFFTEYLMDPLVQIGLGFVPVAGPWLAAAYGGIKGGVEGGWKQGILGGFSGYAGGTLGANLKAGLTAAGGLSTLFNNPAAFGANIGKQGASYVKDIGSGFAHAGDMLAHPVDTLVKGATAAGNFITNPTAAATVAKAAAAPNAVRAATKIAALNVGFPLAANALTPEKMTRRGMEKARDAAATQYYPVRSPMDTGQSGGTGQPSFGGNDLVNWGNGDVQQQYFGGEEPYPSYGPGYALGGYLSGAGDGMSDSIKATIGGSQPARLADGEFVLPADVVSHIGNGSSKAGARRLYSMMDSIRVARTGNSKQGKEINPNRFLPA